MKRNRFSLALVPAVSSALLAFGCGRQQSQPAGLVDNSARACVDADGRRVSDNQCRNDLPTSRSPSFYHWYYGSRGGTFVPIGGFVGGHAFSHGSSSSHSSVSRGGFGSSAHGHGAGA